MKGYVCLFVLLCTGALFAQTSSSEEETVLKTERAWLQAEQQKDIPALQRIIANDFVGNGPGGAAIDKDMIVDIPGDATPFNQTKLVDMSAKVFGVSAVVFGRLETTNPSDPPVMRFAMFYVKRGSDWRMVAAQLVPVSQKNDKGE